MKSPAQSHFFKDFTGLYSTSKTLRFELKPQRNTLENIKKAGFLEQDDSLSKSYEMMKKTITEYHKYFIDQALENHCLSVDKLQQYSEIYNKANSKEKSKDDKYIILFNDIKQQLRKEVVLAFTKGSLKETFSILDKKEFIQDILPLWIESQGNNLYFDDKFKKYTTYFSNFNSIRMNLYSAEDKHSTVAFRLINENLPTFINNINIYERLKQTIVHQNTNKLYTDLKQNLNVSSIDDVFALPYYNVVLTQKQIDIYNTIIGGYTLDNGTKIQGLNEYINLYNQQQNNDIDKLPRFNKLKKQLLSDRVSFSYLPDKFVNISDCLNSINEFYKSMCSNTEINNDKAQNIFLQIKFILHELSKMDKTTIFIKNKFLTSISSRLFGNFSLIETSLSYYYNNIVNPSFEQSLNAVSKSKKEKLNKEKERFLKQDFYSMDVLQKAVDIYVTTLEADSPENMRYTPGCVLNYFIVHFVSKHSKDDFIFDITDKYNSFVSLLNKSQDEINEYKDDFVKDNIKVFLDSILSFLHFIKPLHVDSDEFIMDKNSKFYSVFDPLFDIFKSFSSLYVKSQSLLTQKPYSTDKIKLNFDSSLLMEGWAVGNESQNLTVLLRKQGLYYLAIMDKKYNKILSAEQVHGSLDTFYERMVYTQVSGANKQFPRVFFAKSNANLFTPSVELLEKYNKELHKKGPSFDIAFCHELIDYFKNCLNKHKEWVKFNFVFSPTSTYRDISDFYREVESQSYKIEFLNISENYIDQLVDEGKLYLFQIYNKDFSPYSKGKEQLHTMYWKALFDDQNIKNTVYKLNGGAEIFYRKASIAPNKRIIHPAGQAIKSKNPLTPNSKNTFNYDLIKDKRFTEDKFLFNVNITTNFKSKGTDYINQKALEFIKENPINVIAIDRGERNLVYISVIDPSGKILKQESLNNIENENFHSVTPYQTLLNNKQVSRENARLNWTTIDNIKFLKEGYLSQVVHKISKLMIEYNAIVVLTDLSLRFKRERFKIEKQIYQKFEKALIDKLNYLVFKDEQPNNTGGLYQALQLTSKLENMSKLGKQCGLLLFVPSFYTTNIDPVTGFVDLIKPKYENKEGAIKFFSKFDFIRFNGQRNYFEFGFDQKNFIDDSEGLKNQWVVCSYGDQRVVWNKQLNNNKGGYQNLNITQLIKELLESEHIDYLHGKDLKPVIIKHSNKLLFEKLTYYLSILLMIRYISDEHDYILSPVEKDGKFFDSDMTKRDDQMPSDSDANGAYHIARKGLLLINRIKESTDLKNINLAIKNKDWLEYVQKS